jgi:hypothetical protein
MSIDHGLHERRSLWRTLVGAFTSPRELVRPAPIPAAGHEALECLICRSGFVCPMEWGAADDAHWWPLSRCRECGVWSEIVITNQQAGRLDLVLDRQQRAIHRAAARLEAERMAAEAEAFIDALRRDLIDAADFA